MPLASDADLHLLFLDARTHREWLDQPVEDATLRQIYELARMGPTSANIQPLRLVFVRSAEAKAKLKPALDAGNVGKTMAAPATVIVAHDTEFYEKLPQLSPTRPEMRDRMAAMDPQDRERMALQSATLQAGYVILAARALGLDVGPMGGFDPAKVNAAFFPEGKHRASLLINLGHGNAAKLPPRAPRLDFDEACRIV